MSYFTILVKKAMARRRRKLATQATSAEMARTIFEQKICNTDFLPIEGSFREITKAEHDKIIASLLGRQ